MKANIINTDSSGLFREWIQLALYLDELDKTNVIE